MSDDNEQEEKPTRYSLRERKQRITYDAEGKNSDDDEEEEIPRPTKKRTPKNRKRPVEDEDPDFCDDGHHDDDEFCKTSKRKQRFVRYVPILPKPPPKLCAVRDCSLNRTFINTNDVDIVTIHPFPLQPAVRYSWIKAVRPNQLFWQPPAEYGVCAKHFSPSAKPWCGDAPTLYLPDGGNNLQTSSRRQQIVIKSPKFMVSVQQNQNSVGLASEKNKNQLATNNKPSYRISIVKNGMQITHIKQGSSIIATAGSTVTPSSGIRLIRPSQQPEEKLLSSSSSVVPAISVVEDDDDDDDDEDDDLDDAAKPGSIRTLSTGSSFSTVSGHNNEEERGSLNNEAISAITVDDAEEQQQDDDVPDDSREKEDEEEVVAVNKTLPKTIACKPGEKIFTFGNKKLIIQRTIAGGYLAKQVVKKTLDFSPLVQSTVTTSLRGSDVVPNYAKDNNAVRGSDVVPNYAKENSATVDTSKLWVNNTTTQVLGRYEYHGPVTFYCSTCSLHLKNCSHQDVCAHISRHKMYRTVYECRLCGSTFDSFKLLFCHWRRRACWKKIPFWMCTLSGELTESWTCFICGVKCAQSKCSHLAHHIQVMHSDVNLSCAENHDASASNFKCVVCRLQVYTALSYFNHIGQTHYHLCDVYQSDLAVSLTYVENSTDKRRVNFLHAAQRDCDCRLISAQQQYKRTESTHRGYTVSLLDETGGGGGAGILSNGFDMEKYKRCFHCSKEIDNSHQLISHTYLCTTQCNYCPLPFYDYWTKGAHQILRHWLDRCPYCGRKFDHKENEYAVLGHFRETHKISGLELENDRLCGYPTPLLFEDGAVFYCSKCSDGGLGLYFATQSSLMRYHRFLQVKYPSAHNCVIVSGNSESCIKNRLYPTEGGIVVRNNDSNTSNLKTVKNEPTDETVSSKNKSESAKCASAISVVEDDDDDDDGVERDKDEDVVLEKVDDDVEILQVQKPEPVLVDLACEESKSYYLNHVKPLKCWCKSNLHKRTVHKHRAWALRLDVCEWTDVKRCALCKRRSKSFLTNVVHLSAHFKCARKFCDWCGVGFLNRKFLLEHQKRCQLRFHGVKEMRVLIRKLENEQPKKEFVYPTLSEIEYINSLGIKRKNKEGGDDDDDDLLVTYVDTKEEDHFGITCKFGECFKFFANKTLLLNHVLDTHIRPRWQHGGMCSICRLSFTDPKLLRVHIFVAHREEIIPAEQKSKSSPSPSKKRKNYNSANLGCNLNVTKLTKSSEKKKKTPEKSGQKRNPEISGPSFRCDECNVVLKTMDEFENHMWQVHTGAEEYQCSICKESLKSDQELKEHKKLLHPKYFCHKCLQFFVDRNSCREHIAECKVEASTGEDLRENLKHIGFDEVEKRCEICTIKFRTLTQFNGHVRIHCCKPVAKCRICGKHFLQWKNYFTHWKLCKKHRYTLF